jgi:hypothetical protein
MDDDECHYNGYDEDDEVMLGEFGQTEAAYQQQCKEQYAQEQGTRSKQHQHQRSWANVVKHTPDDPFDPSFICEAEPATYDIATSSDDDVPLGQGFHHGPSFPDNGHTSTTINARPEAHSGRYPAQWGAKYAASADDQSLAQLNAVAANTKSEVDVMRERMEATATSWRLANETAEEKIAILSTQVDATNNAITGILSRLDRQVQATASLNDSVSDLVRRFDILAERWDSERTERSAKTSRTDGSSQQ